MHLTIHLEAILARVNAARRRRQELRDRGVYIFRDWTSRRGAHETNAPVDARTLPRRDGAGVRDGELREGCPEISDDADESVTRRGDDGG